MFRIKWDFSSADGYKCSKNLEVYKSETLAREGEEGGGGLCFKQDLNFVAPLKSPEEAES